MTSFMLHTPMTRKLTPLSALTLGLLLAAPVGAQEQQAGTATDTEAAFQALIDKCDDVDALVLRARIRLQIPRATEEAATTAQKMLDEAFATCGGGDLDGAKAQLTEALAIAEEGATDKFATEGAAEMAEEAAPAAEPEAVPETTETPKKKPWWRVW